MLKHAESHRCEVDTLGILAGNFSTFFKDLVLPMILSGLTMNFLLYEKDYDLAIARQCIVVSNERYEVVALNSNKRHSQK